MIVAILWSVCALLVAVGAVIAVPTALLEGPAVVTVIAYGLLVVAALLLLALMIWTLPRKDAFDQKTDFDRLPPVARWPIRVGWWIGGVATAIVVSFLAFTTAGGGPTRASSRFAMSLMAVLGALATFFTVTAVPQGVWLAALSLWGAVIVLAIGRGLYGLAAALVREIRGHRR